MENCLVHCGHSLCQSKFEKKKRINNKFNITPIQLFLDNFYVELIELVP